MKVCIVGPSGVGKSTIINLFLQRNRNFERFRTYTTRTRRNEKEDEYHYLTEPEFLEKEAESFFFETERVFNAIYGTPTSIIKATNIIFAIDINGSIKMKQAIPDITLIFILPPTISFIENNLLKREEKNIVDRMNRIRQEIKLAPNCNYQIVNIDVLKSVELLESILAVEREKVCAQGVLLDLLKRDKE